MFNYSLTSPLVSSGIGSWQYSLPCDYMTNNFNNTNYLYNSLSTMNPFMMQGYNFYNPTFNGNKTSSTKTTKNEKVEYTPVYASEEIYKQSSETNTDKNKTFGKCLAAGVAIIAAVAGTVALVNGARNYNGTVGQYFGNLGKEACDGVKNLFNNTIGKLEGPVKSAGKAISDATKKGWGAGSTGAQKGWSAISNGTKNGWSAVTGWCSKLLK